MATYAQRPDGLYEVELDDGRLVPTALDPALLEAQGIGPKQPPMQPDLRTADLGSLGTRPMVPGADALGASPAFGQLMGTGQQRLDAPGAPVGPPPAPPPPPGPNMSVMPEGGMSREPPPPPRRNLVPATGAAPQQPPPGGLSDVDQATKMFLAGEAAPRVGGPVRRIPAHDERAAYNIKYRDTSVDPQLEEDISESRIDQQLATQETADRDEYAKSVQARIAAREAAQAQRDVEETLVRKNSIEREVGARIQAIEDRFAKARAVTESGSARERVMRDKGSFGRILAAIGVALGDFAALAGGGRNFAREQIDKEVAEEMEREKQLYNVEPETSALKTYMEAWGTPQQALKELELTKREAVQAQMEAWIRRESAERVPVEFRQWLADQALEIQEAKRKLHEDAAAEVTEQWRRVPEKVVGGGPARPDPLKVMKRAAEFREAYAKATGQDFATLKPSDQEAIVGRTVRLPNGEMAFAPDQKRAQETQGLLTAVGQVYQNIRDIRAIMKKPASEINLADRARIRALVRSNFSVAREIEKTGVPNPADMVLLEPLTGESALKRLDPLRPDVAIEAELEQAEKHFQRRASGAEFGLYRDPLLRSPVRPVGPRVRERE